ncbi:MAG: hypothetical protein QME55_01225 [Brevundimonas sp.]|uniref:hypothetical protein n=1 Tax=Brevundimonas sp. TaxID=1871086 RepID=UPI00261FFE7F|nr:hypothetical protein [Brevundimonas sp.]MDI6623326.1 hypothetical protein [Brevundimonas sp.]MDQ7812755.1 hypothetical protein [Brevundimonas sp.]
MTIVGHFGRHLVVGFLTLPLLGACASFSGAAEPIVTTSARLNLVRDQYPEAVVYRAFLEADDDCTQGRQWPACRDGLTRVEYRNFVVSLYMSAADASYWDFRTRLSQESKGSAFGGNLGTLLLNSVAVVSGDSARRALAAGSAFVAGTQASVHRDLFVERTLPSVLTAMDAARTEAKAEIVTKLRLDADRYTLMEALGDVGHLEDQARLEAAFERLSQTASEEASAQRDRLDAAYVIEVQGSLAERKSGLLDEIEAADDAGLAAIADALGAPKVAGRTAQIGILRVWVDQNIQSDRAQEAAAQTVRMVLKREELLQALTALPPEKLEPAVVALGATVVPARVDQLTALRAWILINVQSEQAYESARAKVRSISEGN